MSSLRVGIVAPWMVRALGGLAALSIGLTIAAPVAAETADDGAIVRIVTLSNRADLVSGGDVLVEVLLPDGVDPSGLTVDVDARDVTAAFALRDSGRIIGLLDGLTPGTQRLTARLPDGRGAYLDITDHPIGGPIFSGAQIQPWLCTTQNHGMGDAVDAQCNAPMLTQYFYMPEGATALSAYDRDDPPADVSMTTTDRGVTVPFIVRQDTFTQNRGLSRTAVLIDPDADWEPWAPQVGWNQKLYHLWGASGGTVHSQSSAPGVQRVSQLGRGFMVATSSMNTLNNNGNTVTSAETLMMLKEHIVETYGEIRYTIGNGGSGGSIGQQTVTNAYPGLIDGVTVDLAFPDLTSIQIEVQDCILLLNYWTTAPLGVSMTPVQQGAIADEGPAHVTCAAQATLFGGIHDPTDGCGLPAEDHYHPEDNPNGCRGALQDYMVAVWGLRPNEMWTEPERIRGGFGKWYYDNVGVEYGLKALQQGLITPEQFVDMNEQVGGFDIDQNIVPGRRVTDPGATEIGYRSGQLNDGSQLDLVPMIDSRPTGNVDALALHTMDHSFSLMQRLVDANGHHDNHVIWRGGSPAPMFDVMDAWLANMEADVRDVPQEQKVLDNRPVEAYDMCFADDQQFDDEATCDALWPYFGEPRTGAGESIAMDSLKCELAPIDRDGDYGPVPLLDLQWERLDAVFPDGVCDYTRPAVDRVESVPWLTYATGPGGTALGVAPTSVAFGSAAPPSPALPTTGGGLAIGSLAVLGAASLASIRVRRKPRATCV